MALFEKVRQRRRELRALEEERTARAEEFAGLSDEERIARLSERDPTVSDRPGFKRRVLGETAPFREAARQSLADLLAEARAPIGQGQLFQEELRAGQVGIQSTLGKLGLERSTTAAQTQAEFARGLVSAEGQKKLNILQFLAGGAETGFGIAGGQIGRQKQEAFAREQLRAEEKLGRRQTIADVVGVGAGIAFG
jgi:hypothetical protein